ncbi:porin family protein [Ferruginibacter sp.]
MKKIIILSGTIFFSLTARSQFSVGIKTGANFSKEKYSNTAVYSTSGHTFFCGGVFANYGFAKHFSAELNVLHSAEGTEESYKSNGSTVTGTVTIKRINIPLLLQYHTQPGIYFETGPQLGLMLSAKGDYTTGKFDFKKYTQSAFFSWCFGAGYKLNKVLPGLGINAVYAPGLSRIDKGIVSAGKITGSTFSVRLAYGFKLKK